MKNKYAEQAVWKPFQPQIERRHVDLKGSAREHKKS